MISDNLDLNSLKVVFKVGFVTFSIIYFFFSLIVVRQVALMTETVITEAGGVLRVLSILFAAVSLGVVIFFIGGF